MAFTDGQMEAVRVRSEGALESALAIEKELRLLASGLSTETWRSNLPELAAMAHRLVSIREIRDRLDAMRERESWPKDCQPSRALASLEHALWSLESAVGLRLQALGIDHGAPILEDAIAQLRARAASLPEDLGGGELQQHRLLVGLCLVAFGISPFHCRNPTEALVPLAAFALLAWQVTRFECPRCEKPFYSGNPLIFPAKFLRGRCTHCGFRPS